MREFLQVPVIRWRNAIMPGEKTEENGAKVNDDPVTGTPVVAAAAAAAAAADGPEKPAIPQEGGWKGAVKVIRRSFDDGALELVYQSYCQRCRESDLDCFFLTGFLIAVHTAVGLSLEQQHEPVLQVLAGAAVSVVLAVAMASLGFYVRHRKRTGQTGRLMESGGGSEEPGGGADRLTYVAWIVANVLILAVFVATPPWDRGSRALTWLLLVNFLTCITLPLRLRVCSALTISSSLVFVVLSAWTRLNPDEMHPFDISNGTRSSADNSSIPAPPSGNAPDFRQQVGQYFLIGAMLLRFLLKR